MTGMQYWFNTRTGQVEAATDPERARLGDLLGPYASQEEASKAYETARAKTEAWDEAEEAEEQWRSGDADAKNWDNNPLNDND